MKDEIKEILSLLNSSSWSNEANQIEDYITNLQQIEQDHKETNATLMSELAKLEEENERLKQPQIFIDTQDMEERYGEELYQDYLKEQLEDYKSRCEKAVEYMQDFIFEPLLVQEDRKLIMFNENLRNFENILQNGSDDNE